MADIKEQTTVNNPGVRAQENAGKRRSFNGSFEDFQVFYVKNKNLVNYLGVGLLALIAGFLYFRIIYLPEQESFAQNEIYHAERYFEQDSFRLALNGGKMVMSPDGQKQMMGFLQIADEYGMTRTGNLAHFYAGVSLLRTGQFETAVQHLEQYDGKDEVLAPIAIGATGDCYMEMGQPANAVKYYLKAADESDNSFTSPFYLRKAGLAHELNKDFNSAVAVYQRIKTEFIGSTEGRDIERDLARVKAMGNLD